MMELHEGGRRRGVFQDANDLLEFKEGDFFGLGSSSRPGGRRGVRSSMIVKPKIDDKELDTAIRFNTLWESRVIAINFFFLELLASAMLVLSSIYVPEHEDDFLKQYVSSIAIVAVMVGMKDKRYFCPDGTFMVSAVLFASGAYNTEEGYNGTEFAIRIIGQICGYGLIFGLYGGLGVDLMKNGVLKYTYDSSNGPANNTLRLHEAVCVVNEFIATFIEGIVVSFAVMPLLKVGSDRSVTKLDSKDKSIAKSEALPPRSKDLWYAALTVGLVHYALERVFRTTMNPLISVVHAFLDPNSVSYFRMIGNVAGLMAACLYCFLLEPTERVYTWFLDGNK
jgi:hypothetical protein